jgi:DNA-binding beta-propeller fold protein YncE
MADINGSDADQDLIGTDGDDRIFGLGGRDRLYGKRGNDKLNGGAGDDWLIGGAGKDTLTGGTGSDLFVFGPADATSTEKVTDFAADDWVGIFASDYGLSEGNGLVKDQTGQLGLHNSYFATISGKTVQGAASGHGQFVFNTGTRTLLWDADGAGTGLSGIALATFNSGTLLSAERFKIITDEPAPAPLPTAAVADGAPNPQSENSSAGISFTVTLSTVANEDVLITYSTVNGTAAAGSDFLGVTGGMATIAAGSTSATIRINLLNDAAAENTETFTLRLDSAKLKSGTPLTITDNSGAGSITDDDALSTQPTVVAIRDTTALGSPDPSGLAYVRGLDTLFLCDSEVNETPFFSTNNMFGLRTDGRLVGSHSLTGFTIEPTGLTYDPATDRLYISDDDKDKVFWVDPDNPQVKLGEFSTQISGQTDAEDLAFDPVTGHLFICNGSYANIREVDSAGTLVRTISLPSEISDPEALVYDAAHGVFFVGGKFSANIWCIDRSGTIIDTIDILVGYPRAGGARARVTDLELAPSSDSTDGGKLSLYVADYGGDQVNDGRLFEIDLGTLFWA